MGNLANWLQPRIERVGVAAHWLGYWLGTAIFETMRHGDPLDRLAVALVDRAFGLVGRSDEVSEKGDADE